MSIRSLALVIALACSAVVSSRAEAQASPDAATSVMSLDAGATPAPAPVPSSGSAIVSAPPVVPPGFVVDPAHPIDDVTTAWDLIKQAGWFWGGMAVLFGVGTFVIKKAEDDHWLNNDHVLSVATASLAVLGAILKAQFGGGSWATVIAVLVAGVALILQKPTPVPSSSTSKAS